MTSARIVAAIITALPLAGLMRPNMAHAADPFRPLSPVPIQKVAINDPFWSPKFEVWRSVTIPDCLAKFEHDGVITNFDHIARGELTALHGGEPWFDGLTYEMIRGIADFLAEKPDLALKARIDGYIDHISAAAAVDPDGYLNTYTQLKEPTHRWGQNGGNDRWQHDLYNAACLVDAAVHYYRATGETRLLTTAVRMSNGMCKVMGPAPKQNIIPGHALGEEALVKLYDLLKAEPGLAQKIGAPVKPDDYLALAKFWIDARGHHEGRVDFKAYDQDEIPVLEQQTLEGHAVRATLMGAGLTAVATHTPGEPAYADAAQRLWKNYVERRMYLTGVTGSFANEEKFGPDYLLPNDCYGETCAAVGNAFYDQEINEAFGNADAVDEFERALYNGALAGVSLKGNTYFYENPLDSGPERKRWDWHACPCCPPMFLKLVGELPGIIYETDPTGGLYVNLFVGSRATIDLAGAPVEITQTTQYPWNGDIKLTVKPAQEKQFPLYIRVPAWARGGATNGGLYSSAAVDPTIAVTLKINSVATKVETDRGYLKIDRSWKPGDTVELSFAMPVQRVTADGKVEADRGRVALMRGPIVYCVESVDNGGHVQDLYLDGSSELKRTQEKDLLGGVTVLHIGAHRLKTDGGAADVDVTAIPYYANANRGPAEMLVWLPADAAHATRPTIANRAVTTASHTNPTDLKLAISDNSDPKNSFDDSQKRFSWWNHKGTDEWIQYTFDQPRSVAGVDVYWWDDAIRNGGCHVPASWRVMYRAVDGSWQPVVGASMYGVEINQFNAVHFNQVKTDALRIEAKLQPNFSAGILRWRVAEASGK